MRRVLLAVVLMLLVFAGCSSAQTSIGDAAQTQPESIESMSVLFVGNSYTHYNQMPSMVEAIGAANGLDISTTMIAPGGAELADHVRAGDAVSALSSGDYDVVVLQEQSVLPALSQELFALSLPAAETLDSAADASGTRVIWFQTWGRELGLPEVGLNSYSDMQRALGAGYDRLADATDGEIARVGESWDRLQRGESVLELYDDDGSHPSATGSYVAALEITETILGRPVTSAPAVASVDQATVDVIVTNG